MRFDACVLDVITTSARPLRRTEVPLSFSLAYHHTSTSHHITTHPSTPSINLSPYTSNRPSPHHPPHLPQPSRIQLLRQNLLTRNDLPALDRRPVPARYHAVGRHVAVQPGQEFSGSGRVAPVAHEVADDGEEGDYVYAGAEELVVGYVADLWLVG